MIQCKSCADSTGGNPRRGLLSRWCELWLQTLLLSGHPQLQLGKLRETFCSFAQVAASQLKSCYSSDLQVPTALLTLMLQDRCAMVHRKIRFHGQSLYALRKGDTRNQEFCDRTMTVIHISKSHHANKMQDFARCVASFQDLHFHKRAANSAIFSRFELQEHWGWPSQFVGLKSTTLMILGCEWFWLIWAWLCLGTIFCEWFWH